MSGFAVNRLEMNKGCGDRSGRWAFEEFMYSDSIFGSAVVEYSVAYIRPHKADDMFFGPGMNVGEIEIFDAEAKGIVIHDDDGNSIPLDSMAVAEASRIVLEAFEAIKDDVQVFESEQCSRE